MLFEDIVQDANELRDRVAAHGQEKRSEDDVAKGIVKYYVEVYDDTDEVVAVATILTMVKKLYQS